MVLIEGDFDVAGSMDEFMQSIYGRIAKGNGERADEDEPGAVFRPENMHRMPDSSSQAKITGACGESMEIYLRIHEEKITEASFYTDGCVFSILCGSMAAKLATEKSVDEAGEIEGENILSALMSIPQEESHCADLAAETLRTAVHDWMVQRRQSLSCGREDPKQP
jgi:nitrogen fixation protein NifU and related proteins